MGSGLNLLQFVCFPNAYRESGENQGVEGTFIGEWVWVGPGMKAGDGVQRYQK